jgi:TM2 domain-containing membrane protein YozV
VVEQQNGAPELGQAAPAANVVPPDGDGQYPPDFLRRPASDRAETKGEASLNDNLPVGPPSEPGSSPGAASAAAPSVSRPAAGVPTKFCFACGALLDARAELCPKCGVRQMLPPPAPAIDAALDRSRVAAGLLGIFAGTFGIHKFYLGKTGQGIVYVIFFWTFVPAIIGFIEGIWYLTMSEAEFQARYPSNRASISTQAPG